MTDLTTWAILIALMVVGVGLIWYAAMGKKVQFRALTGAVGAILLIIGLAMGGSSLGLFTVADIGGDSADVGDDVNVISTFSALTEERGSGSFTALNGLIRVYKADADPGDANTNPLIDLDINSGAVSDTTKKLKTDTEYRVVYMDNGSSQQWYTYDFGVITFGSDEYNSETGEFLFDTSDIVAITKISTFTDIIEETNSNTAINGQSNITTGGAFEIQGDGTPADGETLYYDESEGDGSVYLKINIGAEGANTFLQDVVLCVEYESSAEPEGNELSSVTLQHDSGLSLISTSDFTNFFKNEACLEIGEIAGGSSEISKMILAYDESNLDTDDDFKIILDDLGDNSGKGLLFKTGATKTVIDMDAQA